MRLSVLAALGFTAFLGIMTIDAPDANAIARGTAVVSGPRGTRTSTIMRRGRGTTVVSSARGRAVVSRPRGAVVVSRRRTRF
jgi:hypothetical protein